MLKQNQFYVSDSFPFFLGKTQLHDSSGFSPDSTLEVHLPELILPLSVAKIQQRIMQIKKVTY